ncbi:MAG: family 10 glycosylhydrolase, partial [Ruminococcus sp.]|nr:family 10 glycosylhydrolase [Candidatus Copronaster equi]
MTEENGGNEKYFTQKIEKKFKNCSDLGINTVFVQVRPFADAFYKSEIFPFSSYLTGTQGKDPGYDPLSIIVEQAHKFGLSVHAWINPFRISFSTDFSKLSENNIAVKWMKSKDSETRNRIVVLDNGIYFSPGSEQVQKLIIDGAKEIVKKYDVDGIHIDDYFYPSTDKKTDKFFYDKYIAKGGKDKLEKWRLNTITSLVQGLYDGIKSVNKKCIFSISPAGNIENNYNEQFADVKLWCSEKGYCDWIIPQVYYGFNNNFLPFDKACNQWSNIKTCDEVKIIYGLAAYRVNGKDEDEEWQCGKDIIYKQFNFVRSQNNYDGIALFSYNSIFDEKSTLK